jgi:hypothetical protein
MEDSFFPYSAVHGALLNTGLIASYRNLESRLALLTSATVIADLAPEGVEGGCASRIAMLGLEIAALGAEIDGGAYPQTEAVAALRRIAEAGARIEGLATAAVTLGG